MADHYRAAVDHINEAEQLTDEIVAAYGEAADKATIGRLHHEYGHALKMADIHSTLALVQVMFDTRYLTPAGA